MKINNADKKRLILLDLDGTTLKSDGQSIHPKNIEVIGKLVEKGHHVCIITGRPHRAAIRFYNQLKLNTILTNFDGAHMHDPNMKELKRIVLSISYDITMSILNEPIIKKIAKNILIEYYNKSICWKSDKNIEYYFHLDNVDNDEYIIDNPYNKWNGPSSNIVLIIDDLSKKDELLRTLCKYKNSVRINITKIHDDNRIMILLNNSLATKGFSSQFLAQYYNIDMRDIIAFGDELNDLEMIKTVGYGIAMCNGNDNLKIVARGITHLSNDDGGVGDYLEKLLLKNQDV